MEETHQSQIDTIIASPSSSPPENVPSTPPAAPFPIEHISAAGDDVSESSYASFEIGNQHLSYRKDYEERKQTPKQAYEEFVSKSAFKSSKSRHSASAKAGLQFPVSRVRRNLRAGRFAARSSPGSAVYLTGVLEYCVAEILELAGNAAKDAKVVRIQPRHIVLACRSDEELDRLLNHVDMPGGGVLPYIHKNLLKPEKPSKAEETIVA